MTGTTVGDPLAAHEVRKTALAPYVERVRAWCDEHAREGDAARFDLRAGDRTLAFEPPEFALLHFSALVAADSDQAGNRLAVEAVGLLLKSLDDLAQPLASADRSSTALHSPRAELMLDAAMGNALLTEIQLRTDELVAEGQVEQARVLGKFSHRVWLATAEVEKQIASSELERDRTLAECLTDRPIPSSTARTEIAEAEMPAVEHPPGQHPPGPLEVPEDLLVAGQDGPPVSDQTDQAGPSPTTVLALALLLATVIWLGLFGASRSSGSTTPPLTLGAFAGLLTGIEARPPSLYGSVDRSRWQGLDEQGRLDLVEQVSQVLSDHGYTGALLRTENGVPVAQWLTNRGPLLLEDREAVPAATEDLSNVTLADAE